MYKVNILIKNFTASDSYREENVNFFSLWTARYMAREYASCIDVFNVDVIDNETGELMLNINRDGEVIWDSEG